MTDMQTAGLVLAVLGLLYWVVKSAARRPHGPWHDHAMPEWDHVYFGATLVDDGYAEFEYWRQCMLREFDEEIEPQLERYFDISNQVAAHPKSEWQRVIEERLRER